MWVDIIDHGINVSFKCWISDSESKMSVTFCEVGSVDDCYYCLYWFWQVCKFRVQSQLVLAKLNVMLCVCFIHPKLFLLSGCSLEISCCNRVDKIHDLSSVLGWKHLKNIVFVVIGTCKEERASMLEGNLFLIYGSKDEYAGPLLSASANSFLIPSRYFTLRSRSVNF